MKRQRQLIAVFSILGALIPKSAHAGFFDLFSIAGVATTFFSSSVLMFFQFLNSMLASLLVQMGKLVKFTLDLDVTTNLPVIYEIWKLLRDLCNMGFVIILTVIALSYILSVFSVAKRYATTTNIVNLLVAALIINFSFAVGQAIVFAGNALTKITINLLPNNDIEGALVRGFGPVSARAGNFAQIGVYDPEAEKIEGLSLQALKDVTTAEDRRYNACLQEKTPEGQSAFVNAKVGGSLPTRDASKDTLACAHEILAARRGEEKMRVGQTSSALTPEEKRARNNVLSAAPEMTAQLEISLIIGEMLTVFVNLALLLCFGSIILFLFVRIMAIWILLAAAPVYWFSYGVPGQSQLGTWFNEIKGWALFAPIYFIGIIPGLLVLAQKDQISQSLAQGGSYVAFGGLIFQNIIFYVFVVAVFIGAAAYSRKIAFAGLGDKTGLKGLAGKTGMSMDWAFNKLYSGASSAAQAAYANTLKGTVDGTVAAVSKRVTQEKDDISQSLRNRFNFKSSQEIENTLGRKIGIRGADQKEGGEGGDVAKRIKTRREQIETDNDTRLNAILNPTDRKAEEEAQIAALRTKLSSSDRYEALAAGELLLKKKKLSSEELKQMRNRYGEFSPLAAKAFQDRMHKTIVDELSGREFKDGAIDPATGKPITTATESARKDYEELLNILKEDGNNKAAGEFYKKILSGKQKVAAMQAAVAKGILKDNKGNVITDIKDAYIFESEDFDGKTWQEIEALYPNDVGKLGEALTEFMENSKNTGDLFRTVTDPKQSRRLLARARKAVRESESYKKLGRAKERAQADLDSGQLEQDHAEAIQEETKRTIKDLEDRITQLKFSANQTGLQTAQDALAEAQKQLVKDKTEIQELKKANDGLNKKAARAAQDARDYAASFRKKAEDTYRQKKKQP